MRLNRLWKQTLKPLAISPLAAVTSKARNRLPGSRPRGHPEGVTLHFSRPEKAAGNGFIETINGHVQSECLNTRWFLSLANATEKMKARLRYRITLMHMLCATPLTTFLKVRLPNMLSYLFAGLEVGVVLALIGAIVGEFVGASEGLGSLLIQRQAEVDVSGVFSILVCLSLMGLSLTMAVKAVRRRIVFWEG